MSVRGVLRLIEGDQVGFWCPGCKQMHVLSIAPQTGWTFNGNYEQPTFDPSVLVTGVQKLTDEEHRRVMHGDVVPPRALRCHSFIRGGRIEFLCDCTHELASKTAALLMPVQ